MQTRFLTRQFDITPVELRRAIRQLTPAQRDAIVYCYFFGFTQERAAVTLGCSQRAIAYRLAGALKTLRKKFEWDTSKTA